VLVVGDRTRDEEQRTRTLDRDAAAERGAVVRDCRVLQRQQSATGVEDAAAIAVSRGLRRSRAIAEPQVGQREVSVPRDAQHGAAVADDVHACNRARAVAGIAAAHDGESFVVADRKRLVRVTGAARQHDRVGPGPVRRMVDRSLDRVEVTGLLTRADDDGERRRGPCSCGGAAEQRDRADERESKSGHEVCLAQCLPGETLLRAVCRHSAVPGLRASGRRLRRAVSDFVARCWHVGGGSPNMRPSRLEPVTE